VKRTLRNKVTERLLSEALKLVPAMKAKDIDEERLAKARAEEKAAEADFKKATEETGAEKMAIAAAQKQKEEEMKKVEAEKNVPLKPAQAQAIQGTGSVWNTGSYHWEEKSVNAWANETLKKVISTFTHKMNDVTFAINEITEIKGEAGVSIRKGKKIVSFDYELKLKWEARLCEADKVISKATGTYFLPEVCNDTEWTDWEVRVSYLEDADSIQAFADQLIRSFAAKDLKKTIQEQFVDELKQK
jgi:hypothetical protein